MSDHDDADDLDEVDTHNLIDPSDADDADDDGAPAPNARAVLEYLVKQVVDDPESVDITVSEGRRGPSLDVRVGDGDMGRVIGKRGRVAQGIRTVTRAAAVKDDVSVDIEFLD
ncbi:MAG: hypothetical protein JWN46_845 [Acidimicrobiales bacterium]|nr:hypothetical protein [Acidimicrobiales bacterium]